MRSRQYLHDSELLGIKNIVHNSLYPLRVMGNERLEVVGAKGERRGVIEGAIASAPEDTLVLVFEEF